mmetsp:Transcript_141075/g.450527  ORF Transcript_141075/g.450527 Transcript_141075/m.450527 type:complete len:219 (+) Transcript_141075:1476-2132(+)
MQVGPRRGHGSESKDHRQRDARKPHVLHGSQPRGGGLQAEPHLDALGRRRRHPLGRPRRKKKAASRESARVATAAAAIGGQRLQHRRGAPKAKAATSPSARRPPLDLVDAVPGGGPVSPPQQPPVDVQPELHTTAPFVVGPRPVVVGPRPLLGLDGCGQDLLVRRARPELSRHCISLLLLAEMAQERVGGAHNKEVLRIRREVRQRGPAAAAMSTLAS